jgi:sulfhydrogenase subunit beta (sulfur reductase)
MIKETCMYVIELNDFNVLFDVLRGRGYTVVGPTLSNGAIEYDVLLSVDNLPKGWTDVQEAATYSTERREDDALFGFVVGPNSWKKFLFPPRLKIFSATKTGKAFEVDRTNGSAQQKYAFLGVLPCELQAIRVQDNVFSNGEYADQYYASLRKSTFLIAVNCGQAGGTCFCVSMKTGPKAINGFDLALTEIVSGGRHYFVAEAGTPLGECVLGEVPHRDADEAEIQAAAKAVAHAVEGMGRKMDTENLPQVLNENFDHPHWDEIAKRCLSCANCTLVCPTCFCSTIEDVTDLTGDHAERWRRWDSCFTSDFTRIAGGNIRMSTKTRYRQWMMHKLAHWVDQFGMFGCVGCGRCITWCPVGIDITVEAGTLRETSISTTIG